MRNPFARWLGAERPAHRPGQALLTFGQSTIGRSVSRTGLLLRKQLWIWPLTAVAVLAIVGWFVTRSIRDTMESNLRAELDTLLSVERAMVEKWLAQQEASAQALANDQQVRTIVAELVAAERALAATAEGVVPEPSLASRLEDVGQLRQQLADELGAGMSANSFVGFAVVDKQHTVIASTHGELLGEVPQQYESFLTRTLEGETTVSPPFASLIALKDELGRLQMGMPTMFACAPVRDDNFQPISALCLRLRPEREFTRLLQLGWFGETGETYAFDRQGVMVSTSRFEDDLILLGLIPDRDGSTSFLNLEIRDPGGNLLTGYRPQVRRRELPLTRMATSATQGESGTDVTGYAGYRGMPKVGAWTWLPKYEIGLAVEVDYAEAFRPLVILQRTFNVLFALLVLSAAAIFIFTLVVARLEREARAATIEAKQLGQYRLEERIGSGAMGVVYRGHHAMLRRPTAIKLLNTDRVSDVAIERFEREVQITCQLNNPHTVAIFDYGHTPDGVFYYAMEYLDGIDLQALVERYGPQPEARVARILMQVCASLHEAHARALVHRDIKPANVMLNRRGGECDVVKVLDFGLVKGLDDRESARGGGLAGTPLYMSPEAIQTPDLVDARGDLYAVGAVGYFLLTGQPVFVAETVIELCQQHIDSLPATPSERLGRTVDPQLEHALLACLEKNRAKRPQTARDLAAMLERVPALEAWNRDAAEAWWSRHERSSVLGTNAAYQPGDRAGTDTADTAPASASGRKAPGSTAAPTGAVSAAHGPASTRPARFDQTIDLPP